VTAAPSIVHRYISFNTMQKPFDNPKVREAMNYAINKEALVKVVFSGYAIPAKAWCRRAWKYAVKLGPWPYDPVKARELLKEAGYPNGFETTLWSAYNYTTAQKVIQFVQQQLAQVGIKATGAGPGSRPARREGRELAGPGDRAGAHVLRGLVVVDR
jgi:glutathione transport system substrate-binding protein